MTRFTLQERTKLREADAIRADARKKLLAHLGARKQAA